MTPGGKSPTDLCVLRHCTNTSTKAASHSVSSYHSKQQRPALWTQARAQEPAIHRTSMCLLKQQYSSWECLKCWEQIFNGVSRSTVKQDSWSWTGLTMFSGRLYRTLETSLQDLTITDWLVREHCYLVFPNPGVSLSLTNSGYFRKVTQVLFTQTVAFSSEGSIFFPCIC